MARKTGRVPRRNLTSRPTIDMVPDAKQQKFVAGYLETGEIKAASELAGISERTGQRMMRRPEVLATILAAFHHAGITPEKIAERAHAALNAERPLMKPDGKGGVELSWIPDHPVQLKAIQVILDTAVKLRSLDIQQDAVDQAFSLPENLEGLSAAEILKHMAPKVTIKVGG